MTDSCKNGHKLFTIKKKTAREKLDGIIRLKCLKDESVVKDHVND